MIVLAILPFALVYGWMFWLVIESFMDEPVELRYKTLNEMGILKKKH